MCIRDRNYGGEKGRHLRPQLVQKLESKSVCTWYLAFAMHICVCLEACDYSELSFVARMTDRHGHTDWVCLTVVLACSACLMSSMGGENTAVTTTSSFKSVEHVIEVTAKRRLFLVTSVTPIPTLKMI